jgi:hypothetical protein
VDNWSDREALVVACVDSEAAQSLIDRAPKEILQYVLEQIAKLLPKNPKAQIPFVTTGVFQSVQRIEAEAGTKLREQTEAINLCYPNQQMISTE